MCIKWNAVMKSINLKFKRAPKNLGLQNWTVHKNAFQFEQKMQPNSLFFVKTVSNSVHTFLIPYYEFYERKFNRKP